MMGANYQLLATYMISLLALAAAATAAAITVRTINRDRFASAL